MPAPSGNPISSPSTRLAELGLVLPPAPTPLGAYVESTDAGNLLVLSGMLPVVAGKLAMSGCLGQDVSIAEGQEAARLAALNALAVAQQHVGSLDRLKLLKLTVLISTTSEFKDHARVADGASDLFVQILGTKAAHTRLAFGVQSLPLGAPLVVDALFQIEQ